MKEIFIIENTNDLKYLLNKNLGHINEFRFSKEFKLKLKSDLANEETLLNRYYNECGCNSGAIGLITSALISGLYCSFIYLNGTTPGIYSVLYCFTFIIFVAVMSKLSARFSARIKFRNTVLQLLPE